MFNKKSSGACNHLSVFLGPESGFQGVMNFRGQAHINCPFEGEIKGDGELLIGPMAEIRGNIEAKIVIVTGFLHGDVTATERIELKKPGKLQGNITSPVVAMEEGVQFEGHCTMYNNDRQEEFSDKVKRLPTTA